MNRVAAIIPTIGRPELARAVRSANAQSVPTTALVVLDRPSEKRHVEIALKGLPHELLLTEGNVGGATARNLGVQMSSSDYVAYLDDDDEWHPEKSELQIAAIEQSADPAHAVATCFSRLGEAGQWRIVPEHPFRNDQPIAQYLLRRSTMQLRKNFVQSSSLLLGGAFARSVMWDSELKRHQDWDYLVRLESVGAYFHTVEKPLVWVYQGSDLSVSRSTDWRASEAWLKTIQAGIDSRSLADFKASISLRGAIGAREWTEAIRLLTESIAGRAHLAAVGVGLSAIGRRRA